MEHDDSKRFFFTLGVVIAAGLAFGLLVAIVHAQPSGATLLLTVAVCTPLVVALFVYAWFLRRRSGRA